MYVCVCACMKMYVYGCMYMYNLYNVHMYTIISANIEGITASKASIPSEMCKREHCH